MGACVGAAVGRSEGVLLGSGVGKRRLYVGARVGSTVGASVGISLGSGVGTARLMKVTVRSPEALAVLLIVTVTMPEVALETAVTVEPSTLKPESASTESPTAMDWPTDEDTLSDFPPLVAVAVVTTV